MKKTAVKKVNRKITKGATRKHVAVKVRVKSFAWINRALILIAVVAVLFVSAKGYIALNAIPVEHIIVSGKLEHTKNAALEEMLRPALKGGFLNADLDQIREQLQSLPWVYDVSVRRRWPNALEVHVVEQLPIARWGKRGFLNHEGLIFISDAEKTNGNSLPLLQGPEGAASLLMAIYQQFIEILAPYELVVEELTIDDRGQVEAVLDSGMALVIGNEKHVERLRRFVAIYRSELKKNKEAILRVDLRYQNGLAIAYRETAHVAGI